MKYEVDTRKKTAQDLEAKLVALERRHYEAAGRAEDTKKELERKHLDKVVENESLKKTVENLERKVRVRKTSAHKKLTFCLYFTQLRNSDAEKILKSKEHLEGVYKSLQRQYQAKKNNKQKQTKTI